VSGGTSITKSITKPGGHYTSVFPFTSHGEWERNAAIVRGLSKLRERVVQLERRLRGETAPAQSKQDEEKSS
jgi:UDP-3-O-[3-hydroxymyristoyl] glucosamine N-acyltransferase